MKFVMVKGIQLPIQLDDNNEPIRTVDIQLLRAGQFYKEGFGKFTLNEKLFDTFIAAFEKEKAGELPIDYDHGFFKKGTSKAGGWIKRLFKKGTDELWASVEWVHKTAQQIKDGEYRYISPEIMFADKDEKGNPTGPRLIAASLTNRPFIPGMQPMMADNDKTNLCYVMTTPDAEQPATVQPLEKFEMELIKKQLNLDISADESSIIAAIKEKDAQILALEAKIEQHQKITEGKVLLDSDTLNELQANAKLGVEAKQKIEQMEMDNLIHKAINLDKTLKPSQKEWAENTYKASKQLLLDYLKTATPLNDLTTEIGDGGPGKPTVKDPEQKLITLANEKIKEDKTLSFDQAFEAVCDENNDLYKAYNAAQEKNALTNPLL